MLQDTERQDPLLYIAVSNGAGVQTLLKQYGFPEIDDRNIIYGQLQQLVTARPEILSKLMTEYHPDRQWFTSQSCTCKNKNKEHSKYCAYCGTSNYTTEEAASLRQQFEAMNCEQLLVIISGTSQTSTQPVYAPEYIALAKTVAVSKKCDGIHVLIQDGSGLPVAQQKTTTTSIMENSAVTGVLNWAVDNRKFLTGVAVGIVILAIIKN